MAVQCPEDSDLGGLEGSWKDGFLGVIPLAFSPSGTMET